MKTNKDHVMFAKMLFWLNFYWFWIAVIDVTYRHPSVERKCYQKMRLHWGRYQYTNQQVFNKIVDHMKMQGIKSVDVILETKFRIAPQEVVYNRYYSKKGNASPFGWMIPVNKYVREMEDKSIYSILTEYGMNDLLINLQVLQELQNIHDFNSMKEWHNRFMGVAERNGLEYQSIDWWWNDGQLQ